MDKPLRGIWRPSSEGCRRPQRKRSCSGGMTSSAPVPSPATSRARARPPPERGRSCPSRARRRRRSRLRARSRSNGARSRSGRAGRAWSRSTSIPAAPIATFVIPSRQERPNVSVTITPSERPVRASSAARSARRGRVRILGQQDDLVGRRRVRGVDPGRGADEAVACLGDHERRAAAEHAGRLAQDHLEPGAGRRRPRARAPPRTARPRRGATTRPSAFETTFWATQTTSPSRSSTAAAIIAARSSPSTISGSPSTGRTAITRASRRRGPPPRTASASRRAVRLSFISVRVTCGRTPDRLERLRAGGVGLVDHERVEQARVAARDVRRARPAGEPPQHRVGRALHRLAADERADGDDRGALRAGP